ncbi:MAG: hypothetical protein ACFFCW_02360, partial [Candidatus Hodarchaeota archaeon]
MVCFRIKLPQFIIINVLIILSLIIPFSKEGFSEESHYYFNYPDRASLLAAGWDFLAVRPSGGTRNTEQTT